ncbi:MAG TPA: spore coat U domain-containing protein [Novosphingobium sp.]|nr:spore coat U domain-containing protein [Novosphingobium sp.]
MNRTALIRCILCFVALAGGLAPPSPAGAAGCIVCICTVSTTALSFGTYNPGNSTPTTATATVNASCISVSVPMNATVDLSLSAGNSGNAAARQMANGTARLDYNIYQDSGYSTIWGNGSNGGQLQTMVIANLLTFNASKTAYGRIPARSFPKPGAYTDSIVVTFTF